MNATQWREKEAKGIRGPARKTKSKDMHFFLPWPPPQRENNLFSREPYFITLTGNRKG